MLGQAALIVSDQAKPARVDQVKTGPRYHGEHQFAAVRRTTPGHGAPFPPDSSAPLRTYTHVVRIQTPGDHGGALINLSTSVKGSFTLNGTVVSEATFTVPLNTVHSDQSQRDDQFDNRIMDVARYPNAVFVLTQIDLRAARHRLCEAWPAPPADVGV
jgi:hypothetical protein